MENRKPMKISFYTFLFLASLIRTESSIIQKESDSNTPIPPIEEPILIENHTTITVDQPQSIDDEPVKNNTLIQSTFAIIKPDAVNAGFTGQIIDYVEKNGFEITRMEKKRLTQEEAENFYSEHKEKPFYQNLITFMTSGPIIILSLTKENAVAEWRSLIGSTNPEKAMIGTIRYMFGSSKEENAVHGSDSTISANREIALLFGK